MAKKQSATDAELEQLRRCNHLMVSMLCHLISSGFDGRAIISEESLNHVGSLQISHQMGGRLVLTVAGRDSAASQLMDLAMPLSTPRYPEPTRPAS